MARRFGKTPTSEIYAALSYAFAHFNRALYLDTPLPDVIFVLEDGRNFMGYFRLDRFRESESGRDVSCICMNPLFFCDDVKDVLSTLVHEMTHLFEYSYGARTGKKLTSYHNKAWANHMQLVGLTPRSLDRPGKQTGRRVTHSIVAGGLFDQAAEQLLAEGFELVWRDAHRLPRPAPEGPDGEADPGESGSEPEGPPPKPKKRHKYSCPSCGLNAWAKPGAGLKCAEHDMVMEDEDEET